MIIILLILLLLIIMIIIHASKNVVCFGERCLNEWIIAMGR